MSWSDAGSRWWRRTFHGLTRRWQRRRRQTILLALVAAWSVGLIVYARSVSTEPGRFTGDLLLNIGAGLGITITTYIVLNPLFVEIQSAAIIDHPRLDKDKVIDHIAQSRHLVSILETFIGMMDGKYQEVLLAAFRVAIGNGVRIKILLLEPDSDGARLRSEELRGQRDVEVAIHSNIYHLGRLYSSLPADSREYLEVRTYSSSASVQMYRWDGKAYICFFPINQLSLDSSQLETHMSTQLGYFVQRRFDELWESGEPVDLAGSNMQLRVFVRESSGRKREIGTCGVRSVQVDGGHHVTSTALVRMITKFDLSTLRAEIIDDRDSIEYIMQESDDFDSAGYRRVLELFAAKHGFAAPFDDSVPFLIALTPTPPAE